MDVLREFTTIDIIAYIILPIIIGILLSKKSV
jgi:hypothetical protein